MRRTSRNSFNFDFSLRRLLLQGARAARGSPPLGQRLCDVEKGSGRDGGGGPSGSSSSKHHDKASGSSHSGSHKVRQCFCFLNIIFRDNIIREITDEAEG